MANCAPQTATLLRSGPRSLAFGVTALNFIGLVVRRRIILRDATFDLAHP